MKAGEIAPLDVLIADNTRGAQCLAVELEHQGLAAAPRVASDTGSFASALDFPPDLVLADLSLPDFDALGALLMMRERGLDLPFIVIAGATSEEKAARCLEHGADDYVLEGRLARLGQAVRDALARHRLREDERRAEAALAERDAELAAVFESAPVAIFVVDSERRVRKANHLALAFMDSDSPDGLRVGTAIGCVNHVDDPRGCGYGPHCQDCPVRTVILDTAIARTSHRGVECAMTLRRDSGPQEFTLLLSSSPVVAGGEPMVVVCLEDVTAARATAQHIRNLNRLLATIREVNHLIVHETDRQSLLDGTCRIAVSSGGFPLTWVGMLDEGSAEVRLAAVAGAATEVVAALGIRTDESPRGRGPSGTAVREARTVVVHDLERDPSYTPWREAATTVGLGAYAAIPLLMGGSAFGVLGVFARSAEELGDEAIALLEEMASDLTFALDALAERERRVESERRFRDLADFLPQPVYEMDLDGRFTFANRIAFELLGFVPTDLDEGRSVWGMVAPEQHDDVRRRMAELAGGRALEPREYWVLRKDGRRLPALIYNSPILCDGRVLGVRGLMVDISERKRAEEALAASERQYRAIFEAANDAILIFDPDTEEVLEANTAACTLYGFPHDELVGASLKTMSVDVPRGEAKTRELLDGGPVINFETVQLRRDGTPMQLLVSASVVDYRGRTAILSHNRDVTQLKVATAKLEASEERYRRLFQEDLTGNFVTTPDGRLLDCNPAFAAILGYGSAEEMIGMDVRALYPSPPDRADLLHLLRKVRRVEAHQVELRRKDGSTVQVIENVVGTFGADGELNQIHGYLFDVSELHCLEEQLRQAQKMEAVGRLAGGVAHDFNNLLQAMLGRAQLVAFAAENPVAVRASAAELEEQINRGAALTRQLLLFSRREQRRPEHLDLAEVVGGSAKLLRRLLRENVQLEVPEPGAVLPVEADRSQLEQVLMNLAINAADAMPEGGTVTVSAGVGAAAREVWLEVTDTGHGMTDDVRERIFEPFFTTKEADKGTGLGLAVVHGIVTQHGGHVEVESTPGVGSRFRVVLPASGGLSLRVSESGSSGCELPRGAGERILVVEDEPHARVALAEILEHLGYRVDAVASAEDAVELAGAEPFGLLLSDLVLPGVSGSELAKRLRLRWPDLRVVLMSGYTDDDDLRRQVEAGAVRFLQKPFQIAELAGELRSVFADR